jgi:hypothetical protein
MQISRGFLFSKMEVLQMKKRVDNQIIYLSENHGREFGQFLLDDKVSSLLYSLWFHRKILRRKDVDEFDREVIRGNVSYTLGLLDKESVPFWVQNKILDIAERDVSFDEFRKAILN